MPLNTSKILDKVYELVFKRIVNLGILEDSGELYTYRILEAQFYGKNVINLINRICRLSTYVQATYQLFVFYSTAIIQIIQS